ncbi:1291_t:CDS:2, partial [Gigaspora margarita]
LSHGITADCPEGQSLCGIDVCVCIYNLKYDFLLSLLAFISNSLINHLQCPKGHNCLNGITCCPPGLMCGTSCCQNAHQCINSQCCSEDKIGKERCLSDETCVSGKCIDCTVDSDCVSDCLLNNSPGQAIGAAGGGSPANCLQDIPCPTGQCDCCRPRDAGSLELLKHIPEILLSSKKMPTSNHDQGDSKSHHE